MKALFGAAPKVTLEYSGEGRQEVKGPDGSNIVLIRASEPVAGLVTITLPDNATKFDHTGITAELIGQIELNGDRGNHYIFHSMVRQLASAGTITKNRQEIDFSFEGADKSEDSYLGINATLRYFVRIRISRSYGTKIQQEFDFAVQTVKPTPEKEANPPLKMEVGIEDCLHIEFEYEKSKYGILDVINGKVNFLLVRIKIKHMEMQILKKETTGEGQQKRTESEVITHFEIMDGAPVKGESIPIRLHLKPFAKENKLTPTQNAVQKKFSVKYFLNLVLLDMEERRYFKQQEIVLYRDR